MTDSATAGGRPDLACREFVDLITAYLEDALPPDEADAVRAHLAVCRGCEEYLAQMRRTIALLGHVPVATLSAEACDELVAAFRAAPHGHSVPE
jgi:anti-sigma factor RsiW